MGAAGHRRGDPAGGGWTPRWPSGSPLTSSGAPPPERHLKSHSWDDYAKWHFGLTVGAKDGTKARYAFVYGDFRRIHGMGLIACSY